MLSDTPAPDQPCAYCGYHGGPHDVCTFLCDQRQHSAILMAYQSALLAVLRAADLPTAQAHAVTAISKHAVTNVMNQAVDLALAKQVPVLREEA